MYNFQVVTVAKKRASGASTPLDVMVKEIALQSSYVARLPSLVCSDLESELLMTWLASFLPFMAGFTKIALESHGDL